MKQFVDEIYAIVLVGSKDGLSKEGLEDFKDDIGDFGILKWNVEDPSLGVNFLDLTLTINYDNNVSKNYQKWLNLYQFIYPNSAHSPCLLKGVVFSMLKRYYCQNSHLKDFWETAMLLYKPLKDQGWDKKNT